MSYAREMGFAVRQASESEETKRKLREGLGFSQQQLEKLYKGRLFLTGPGLLKAAEICGVPAETLVNSDTAAYDAEVVHCMSEFKDRGNREMILDLIDAYIDAKEALARAEMA